MAPGTSLTGNYVTGSGVSHLNDASAINCFNDKIGILNALTAMTCNVSLPIPELGGTTQGPGVMCYESMSLIGTVTLDGMNKANATFVFQTSKALVVEYGGKVNLINGAQAKNVYWAIGSSASIKSASDFVGQIVAGASITMDTNVRVLGRALAGAAVSFAGLDAIALPADSYMLRTNVTQNMTMSNTTRASTTTVVTQATTTTYLEATRSTTSTLSKVNSTTSTVYSRSESSKSTTLSQTFSTISSLLEDSETTSTVTVTATSLNMNATWTYSAGADATSTPVPAGSASLTVATVSLILTMVSLMMMN